MRIAIFAVKLASTGALGVAIFAALATIGYLPSDHIEAEASRSADEAGSLRRVATALATCSGSKGGRVSIAPERLRGRIIRLRSWQNDAGFLATTEIACLASKPCRIKATALIPAKGRHSGCFSAAPFVALTTSSPL